MLKSKKMLSLSLGLLSAVSLAVQASPTDSTRVIVAPKCLIKNLTAPHKTLSAGKELVMFETNDAGIDQLIEAKHNRKQMCGGFMDVTSNWKEFSSKMRGKTDTAKSFLSTQENTNAQGNANYSIQYQAEVEQIFKQNLNPDDMWNDLATITSWQDRYAKAQTGVDAAMWFKAQVEAMAKQYGHKVDGHDDVTVYTVATGSGSYKQPSVVAKFGSGNGPGIVVGGHMDTLNGEVSRKPGADDDGSGSVTVLQTARSILSSGKHFKKPIYFIWYAAEEQGLVGSGYVVRDFKNKNIPVSAVLQLDMTGYSYKGDPSIWLINDYVNKNLTTFLSTLITTYVKQPVKNTQCGYACSDHASWTQGGFVAAMPFESSFNTDNPNIHSSNDKMDHLSKAHMTNFAKLAVAFAVELAEPVA